MTVDCKVTESGGNKKITCPFCGTKTNNFWLREKAVISGLTFKCKCCGKTIEVSAVS